MVRHQGKCDNRDVAPLADNRGPAKLDLVIFLGYRTLDPQKLSVLEEALLGFVQSFGLDGEAPEPKEETAR